MLRLFRCGPTPPFPLACQLLPLPYLPYPAPPVAPEASLFPCHKPAAPSSTPPPLGATTFPTLRK